MKKTFLIITTFLLFFAAAYCFSKNTTVTITGYINSYGNEPFTYPGIKTEDGKVYGIIAEPDVKLELLNSQGNKVELTGKILNEKNEAFVPEKQKDGFFEVESWEIVK